MIEGRCPRAAREVLSRTIAGETLLVPVTGNLAGLDRVFLLNSVGAFLWPLLDGQRRPEDLVTRVREQFAVDESHDVPADIAAFLGELERRGLIDYEADGPR